MRRRAAAEHLGDAHGARAPRRRRTHAGPRGSRFSQGAQGCGSQDVIWGDQLSGKGGVVGWVAVETSWHLSPQRGSSCSWHLSPQRGSSLCCSDRRSLGQKILRNKCRGAACSTSRSFRIFPQKLEAVFVVVLLTLSGGRSSCRVELFSIFRFYRWLGTQMTSQSSFVRGLYNHVYNRC